MIKTLRRRPPSQHQDQNNKRKRALWIILVVIVIFLVAWAPLTIFTLVSEYYPQFFKKMMGPYHDIIYGMMHLLGATNSIANPILYGYMNENFRHEYRKFYKQMPWYKHSLVLVRSIRRNVLPRNTTEFVEAAHHNLGLIGSSSNKGSDNEVSLPPKRLRKMKTSEITLTQQAHVVLSLDNSTTESRVNNNRFATVKRATSFDIKSHDCKQRDWMKRTSSLLNENIGIDITDPSRFLKQADLELQKKKMALVYFSVNNTKPQVRFLKNGQDDFNGDMQERLNDKDVV